MTWHVGVDVGGTFTDLAALDAEGRVTTAKVLSDPADQSNGVLASLDAFGASGESVARVVHGTTVVTNLLLERTGARVALCATEGHTDVLRLRRQARARLYDLTAHHPPPLVPVERTVAVPERIEPHGIVRALTPEAAAEVADAVAALAPEAVAVSLLHAYRDEGHERLLGAALARRLPGVDIVLSSDVLPEIREYERAATTSAEAYARPRVARYLARLSARLAERGVPAPMVMTSSGGVREAREAERGAASLALSGPAGGVAGAAAVLRALGADRYPLALTIDIGGTSADVGLIVDGEPLVEAGGTVAGVPIALPRVLVETVSAGGGSVGWVDDAGALRAGPRSAGAVPGPAAFARGGTEATITDAHLALGHIGRGQFQGGVAIDPDLAVRAVASLAERVGLGGARDGVERVARALLGAADAEMARALRRVSVERGLDPRACVLVAFGGGGPLHACALAEQLGVRTVLVPPHAGVLSAVGLALAPARREAIGSVMRRASELAATDVAALVASLGSRAGAAARESRTWVRARYAGQGHELEVPLVDGDDGAAIARRFAETHRARMGFTLAHDVELVSARHAVSDPGHAVRFARRERAAPATFVQGAMVDDGAALDATVHGAATVALPDATLRVADGWTARALPTGGWLVEVA
ncbi:Hydantoinase/oxoprolinase [Gemmatirosa kalamazoonensis]|uniref:Hydantoinase/oxoprolinase n=1 Tax=Gemmatirosa kalamazoonensis TaxID=861299 RepID=W0RH69_9BACT|nr:hydantoinase/oxoprolinase family protein [Gemmatirosa kalamazoonensis]AHG90469.1 Hydantoinase/oxoprolinase [Gemmatirosa kalamazoonensis]